MIKEIRGGVWYKPDGKEVCMDSRQGKREYEARTFRMSERQGFRCAMCAEPLASHRPTFDHEDGRGAGRRDDRIEVDGRWQNAALHLHCNNLRGSRRTPYVIAQNSCK